MSDFEGFGDRVSVRFSVREEAIGFPLCTPWRRANVSIAQDEYDRLREATYRLADLERGRPQTLGEVLREAFDPPMQQPVYIHSQEERPRRTEIFRLDNGARVEIRGERPIDAATGRPWQAGEHAHLSTRARTKTPRGYQEPIERVQPIRVQRGPELDDPAAVEQPEWLTALGEIASSQSLLAMTEQSAAVYRPLTGGPARPPDRAPGEKSKKPRKVNRSPRKNKRATGRMPVYNWPVVSVEAREDT